MLSAFVRRSAGFSGKALILPFIGLLLLAYYVSLILGHRIPLAHDTYEFLQLQYIYYNELLQHRSIPLWLPFQAHGLTTNYLFLFQAGLLSPVLYLLALLGMHVNFLYLFYLEMWIEELFFLTGVFLLAGVYFRSSKTVLYVCLVFAGTSIWFPQICWNFHIYYFLPMVFYCLHRLFEKQEFKYLCLAFIFQTLSVMGNALYVAIYTSFVTLVYGLVYLAFHAKTLKWGWVRKMTFLKVVLLACLLAAGAGSLSIVKYRSDQLAVERKDRGADMSVSEDVFLNWGGAEGLGKYKELLTRQGLERGEEIPYAVVDKQVYGGFLLIPLALGALLFSRERQSRVVGLVALVLFLFSVGWVIPQLFYRYYPFGKFFRHIGFTAPVFKMFLVFYAGFGLDCFLQNGRAHKGITAVALVYLAALIVHFVIHPVEPSPEYYWFMNGAQASAFKILLYASLGGLLLVLLFFLFFRRGGEYAFWFLLLLTLMDVFSYKHAVLGLRMPVAAPKTTALFEPYDYPYQPFRGEYRESRYPFLVQIKPPPPSLQRFQDLYWAKVQGTLYETILSFVYTDLQHSSLFRRDMVLRPVQVFLDGSLIQKPADGVFEKLTGQEVPKLGIFSKIHALEDEGKMSRVFAQPDFTADMLFSTGEDLARVGVLPSALVQTVDTGHFLNAFDRVEARAGIEEFSFNRLVMNVEAACPQADGCFLYYADAYHPDWAAFVDGKKTPVIRTNTGYKSVLIPRGKSRVEFRFGSRVYSVSIACTVILLVLGLGGWFYLLRPDVMRRPSRRKEA